MPISLGFWEWGCPKRRDAHITGTSPLFLSPVSSRFLFMFALSATRTRLSRSLEHPHEYPTTTRLTHTRHFDFLSPDRWPNNPIWRQSRNQNRGACTGVYNLQSSSIITTASRLENLSSIMADMKMLRVLGGIGVLLATTMAGTLLLDLKPQRKMVLFRIQIILIFFMLMCAITRFVWISLTVLLPSRRTDSKTLLVVHWLSYAFLVIIVALSFFSIPVSRLSIGREPFFITRVAFTCLGLVILLFFNLCFLSAIFTILWFFKCRFPNANKWKAVLASAVSIFMCIHGLSAASKGPSVVGKTIPLAKLPPSFYGTTIVQLSDIHLGPMVGSTDLERVVNRVLMIKPDIVVITGDLVDSTVEKLKQVVLPLKKLSSRYGVFFVTGKVGKISVQLHTFIMNAAISCYSGSSCKQTALLTLLFQLPYKLFIPISSQLSYRHLFHGLRVSTH